MTIDADELLLRTGSHFMTHADFGCKDGVHKAWMIVERESKEDARSVLPSELRPIATIVGLNYFTMPMVEELMRRHEAERARAEVKASGVVQGYALKNYSDGLLWKCVLEVAAGQNAFPTHKSGWLALELPDQTKLRQLDRQSVEVLGALAALPQIDTAQEYVLIKELTRVHATHVRLGQEGHVRRVLERVRRRLGMRSVEAARWFKRVSALP